MAVKIRLRRMGRRKHPVFALVAADGRSPRDGRFIEDLGRYEPIREPATVSLKEDRILYWLQQGAQPSDTVRNLLSRQGLMLQLHLLRKGKSPEEIEQAVAEFREARGIKEPEAKKTAADRRREALEAERQQAEAEAKKAAEERKAREAELARQKAEAEAEARKKADEARKEALEAEKAEVQTETDEQVSDKEADEASTTSARNEVTEDIENESQEEAAEAEKAVEASADDATEAAEPEADAQPLAVADDEPADATDTSDDPEAESDEKAA